MIQNTPWDWTGTPQYEGGAFHCYIVDSTGRKIGAVWGPSAEKIARAHLWATAPDLLEVVEEWLTVGNDLKARKAIRAKARAAIAKAHGGQQ